MARKSGQPLSPCVEIDGVMLADVSGEEIENYLLANNLVLGSSAAPASRPASDCAPGEAQLQPSNTPIRFF